MGYVETMFGHQSEINALDSWRKERIVTGGRDRTVSDGCVMCDCFNFEGDRFRCRRYVNSR